jgi:tellurite resistance protein TehA-like permease
MSTGAIAVLLSQQPNSFRGLETIGKTFFILDVVLFLSFCALICTRFIFNPQAFTTSLHHQHESFFFGAFWVSVALILYCIEQYGVPSCGPWLVKTMEVCFWIYAACALLVSIFQYHVIFDVERLPVTEMMPAWILPIYPVIILGPLAGAVLSSQPSSAGTPILIGAIAFQGLGWMFGIFIYSLWIARLTNSDLPDESQRPGMYVAVGPAGMSHAV